MTISGTTDWNPDFGDIIEEAYELCGVTAVTGNDLRTARRSMNYLQLEWANEGINLWTIEERSIDTLTDGTATYDVPIDTISILDAVIRTDNGNSNQLDITCNRISSTTYAQIPSKLQEGRPSRFWFNRIGVQDRGVGDVDRLSTVTFWPIPDITFVSGTAGYQFVYWALVRMADAVGMGDTMDIPERFHPALVLGLAAKLAIKKAPGRLAGLQAEYNRIFEKAKDEDRVKEDLHIVPRIGGHIF